jgi:hypothetical protein
MSKEEEEVEWEKTRDIDNPLSPWIQVRCPPPSNISKIGIECTVHSTVVTILID